MDITVDMIKLLRQKTSAGVMDCKRALEDAKGDPEGAEDILKEKGLAAAAKRIGRETKEGLVESYIHMGARVGSLVELGCETDFVARTSEFKELAHNLAMQVAAMPSTSYVDHDEIKEDESRPVEVSESLGPILYQGPLSFRQRCGPRGNGQGRRKHQGQEICPVRSWRIDKLGELCPGLLTKEHW